MKATLRYKYTIVKKETDTVELSKEKSHIIIAITESVPNSVVSKIIIKKLPVTLLQHYLMKVKNLRRKLHLLIFTFRSLTDQQNLPLMKNYTPLKLGDGIIIPCHKKHKFTANEQFKMITTVIKSSFDDR